MVSIQILNPKENALKDGIVNVKVYQGCYDSTEWVVHRVTVEEAQQIAVDLAAAIKSAQQAFAAEAEAPDSTPQGTAISENQNRPG